MILYDEVITFIREKGRPVNSYEVEEGLSLDRTTTRRVLKKLYAVGKLHREKLVHGTLDFVYTVYEDKPNERWVFKI